MGTIVSKKKKNRSQPQGPSGMLSKNNNNDNQSQANKPVPVIVNKQVTHTTSEKVPPTTSEKVESLPTTNQSVSNKPGKPILILTTAKSPSAKSNCAKQTPTGINTDDIELSYTEASKLQPETPDEMWKIVKKTSPDLPIDLKPTTSRKGWKTIRLFVSSTFKDFHQEREVLVKEVFPDLRLWCESRKLRLVECDLRWGVPKDSTTEDTIKICLSELDRCYEDNVAPFFLNLAGNRTGWIPTFNAMSVNLASQYGWVYGLTVTEMEIVHGAFRKLNPNALFLLRNVNGLEDIPEEIRKDFFSEEPFHQEKLKSMKDMIVDRFPESNVKHYSVESNYDAEAKRIDFNGLRGSDSEFSDVVYNFFQKRIEELYPLDLTPQNPLQVQKEAHEMFLDIRSAMVLGRDKLLNQNIWMKQEVTL